MALHLNFPRNSRVYFDLANWTVCLFRYLIFVALCLVSGAAIIHVCVGCPLELPAPEARRLQMEINNGKAPAISASHSQSHIAYIMAHSLTLVVFCFVVSLLFAALLCSALLFLGSNSAFCITDITNKQTHALLISPFVFHLQYSLAGIQI